MSLAAHGQSSVVYEYDALARRVAVSQQNTATQSVNVAIRYDAVGNRMSYHATSSGANRSAVAFRNRSSGCPDALALEDGYPQN